MIESSIPRTFPADMSISTILNDEPLPGSVDFDPEISELEHGSWSVISFERCEESGLAYPRAVEKLEGLETRGIAGLCIVTDEAARNLSRRKN
jgi:hypothetical protein